MNSGTRKTQCWLLKNGRMLRIISNTDKIARNISIVYFLQSKTKKYYSAHFSIK